MATTNSFCTSNQLQPILNQHTKETELKMFPAFQQQNFYPLEAQFNIPIRWCPITQAGRNFGEEFQHKDLTYIRGVNMRIMKGARLVYSKDF